MDLKKVLIAVLLVITLFAFFMNGKQEVARMKQIGGINYTEQRYGK